MSKIRKYCKAYPVKRFREFSKWSENLQNLRKEKTVVDGNEIEAPRQLTEDAFFYLQDNFTVTDGIFLDQNVIFDNITPEWKDFCENVLNFTVPDYETTA